MRSNVYRDGKVHVVREMCETCIFRPGNLMQLQSGRVRGMIDDCKEQQGTIPCHNTLYIDGADQAVCRGFFDRHKGDITALELADAMGIIEYDEPRGKDG